VSSSLDTQPATSDLSTSDGEMANMLTEGLIWQFAAKFA
jgi:hypothetical protein